MIDFLLNFSQATGIYAFMNSPWGWPIAESIHFFGLCLLIGTVGLFDLRMMGFANEITLAELHRLVPIGVAGLFIECDYWHHVPKYRPRSISLQPCCSIKIILHADRRH